MDNSEPSPQQTGQRARVTYDIANCSACMNLKNVHDPPPACCSTYFAYTSLSSMIGTTCRVSGWPPAAAESVAASSSAAVSRR